MTGEVIKVNYSDEMYASISKEIKALYAIYDRYPKDKTVSKRIEELLSLRAKMVKAMKKPIGSKMDIYIDLHTPTNKNLKMGVLKGVRL